MKKVLVAVLVMAGCARDVRTHFPTPPDELPGDTGSITLVLTRPASDVYVAIDGILVVDGANTSRIHIDGIPSGYASVAVALGDGEKTAQVWIEPGRDTAIPLPSPGGSPW